MSKNGFKKGDVILCSYPSGRRPDGKIIFKKRPLIVRDVTPKGIDAIPVIYCTGENKSLEYDCIFVDEKHLAYKEMGLSKDTYIVPRMIIKPMNIKAVLEIVGTCPLMDEIEALMK